MLSVSILALLTSCSSDTLSEAKNNINAVAVNEQNVTLQVSKIENKNYTLYKKIKDLETVNTILNVLQQVPWKNAKVSMSHMPDYKIVAITSNPQVSYIQETYDLWISPKQDLIEVIIEGKSKYGKLSKEDSTLLLKILETQ